MCSEILTSTSPVAARGRPLSVWQLAFDDTDDLFGVESNSFITAPVIHAADQNRPAIWRILVIGHVMEAFKRGNGCVDFDEDLFCILHNFLTNT